MLYWIDGPWVGRLAIAARPRGGDWLADEMAALRSAGVDVLISTLTPQEEQDFELLDEARQAKAAGIKFVAYPIPDRTVPTHMDSVEKILRSVEEKLGEGMNVGIHCRQGIGRSALLAAAALLIGGMDVKQIWNRVEKARGRPVPETKEQEDWLEKFAAFLSAPLKR